MTIGCSSVRHLLIAATVLLTHPVQAQGGFEPFSALSNGKDCSINLGFPEVGAFYWTVLAPDIVNPGREEWVSIQL